MQKKITIYSEANNLIIPFKVGARRVLNDLHPQYNFWVHDSITDGGNFSVSEGSSGYSIGHGLTEKSAIKSARNNLTKHSIEVISKLISEKVEFVKKCKGTFLNDPLWNAMSSVGYTPTQSELADIRQSLAADGYEITKIKTD